MDRLRSAGAPLVFAARRLRARPLASAGLVVALAAAAALIGWSSLTAATSQESNVRTQLERLPPGLRSFEVVYFTVPPEADSRAATVRETVAGFRDVTGPVRQIRVWHSIEPGNPLGTRIVLPDAPAAEVTVHDGRLPSSCGVQACVAIADLEHGDSLVRAHAPLGILGDLVHRGDVARERLLIVAGEAAALVVAFAAFLATARRRESELADDQLTNLGAGRG